MTRTPGSDRDVPPYPKVCIRTDLRLLIPTFVSNGMCPFISWSVITQHGSLNRQRLGKDTRFQDSYIVEQNRGNKLSLKNQCYFWRTALYIWPKSAFEMSAAVYYTLCLTKHLAPSTYFSVVSDHKALWSLQNPRNTNFFMNKFIAYLLSFPLLPL